MRVLTRAVFVLACLLIIPAAAYAQASLTGTAKDSSGAVLPVVTVEAASGHWVKEVRRSSSIILKRLHTLLGPDVVTAISVRERA